MSMYLGKDNSGNPLIHVTAGVDSVNVLKSVTAYARSVFHSNSSYIKVTEVGTAYGYYGHWADNPNWRRYAYYNVTSPTAVQDKPAGAKVFNFGIYTDGHTGVTSFVGSDVVSGKQYFWRSINYSSSSRLATTAETRAGSITFYAITVIGNTSSGKDVQIGKGGFRVGNFNVHLHSFLSRGRVNTIDTFYNVYNFGVLQILNSKKSSSSYSGFGLNNNSLGFSYAGVLYNIFSSGVNAACIIRKVAGNDVFLSILVGFLLLGSLIEPSVIALVPTTGFIIVPVPTYSVTLPAHSNSTSFFLVITINGVMVCVKGGTTMKYSTGTNGIDGTPTQFIRYNPTTHVVDGIAQGTNIQYIEVG